MLSIMQYFIICYMLTLPSWLNWCFQISGSTDPCMTITNVCCPTWFCLKHSRRNLSSGRGTKPILDDFCPYLMTFSTNFFLTDSTSDHSLCTWPLTWCLSFTDLDENQAVTDLRNDHRTVTIPQYRVNKTKQRTQKT